MCILENKWVQVETLKMEVLLEDFKLDSDIINGDQDEIVEPQTKFNQIYPIASQTLRSRLKRQRLTISEKIHVYDLAINHKVSIKNIACDFQLSASAVRSSINKIQSNRLQKWNSNATKRNLMSSCLVQNLIEDFFQKDNNPKIVKDVWVYIYGRSGINVSIHLARQFMKEKLWLTYKVGKSRLALLNEHKHLIIKSYFAVRVAKLLPFIDIIVNVDEASFSHYLMKNRSWPRK